jgi:hypothetical protein
MKKYLIFIACVATIIMSVSHFRLDTLQNSNSLLSANIFALSSSTSCSYNQSVDTTTTWIDTVESPSGWFYFVEHQEHVVECSGTGSICCTPSATLIY